MVPQFFGKDGHPQPPQAAASGSQTASPVTASVIHQAATVPTTSGSQTASCEALPNSMRSWGHKARFDFVSMMTDSERLMRDGGVRGMTAKSSKFRFVASEDHYDKHPSEFWNPAKQVWIEYDGDCSHGPYENKSLPIGWQEWRTYDGRVFYHNGNEIDLENASH